MMSSTLAFQQAMAAAPLRVAAAPVGRRRVSAPLVSCSATSQPAETSTARRRAPSQLAAQLAGTPTASWPSPRGGASSWAAWRQA